MRDLIFIIRATPSEVGPGHPFCEMRMTSWGQIHRFPSKMAALTLLARILGWNGPAKLEAQHEVQERIAELFREAAAQTAYEKTNAVRDLLAIIHTPPSLADDENPLCEVRMGKGGPYHRLPPKLQAMSRLIKFMGWDEPVKVEVELKDNFRDLLARIRKGGLPNVARHSDVENQEPAPCSPLPASPNHSLPRACAHTPEFHHDPDADFKKLRECIAQRS